MHFSWAATSSSLDLWTHMTSFIKREVHNVSLRLQRRIETRPQVTCTKNLVTVRHVLPEICWRIDTVITILCSPIVGRVTEGIDFQHVSWRGNNWWLSGTVLLSQSQRVISPKGKHASGSWPDRPSAARLSAHQSIQKVHPAVYKHILTTAS